MDLNVTHQEKNLATLIHLSVFSQFFVPFGNFIFPLVLWLVKKNSSFVDHHGRTALNFQISLFLYMILLICFGISGIIFLGASLSISDPFFISSDHVELQNFSEAIPIFVLVGTFGILLLGLLILQIFGVVSASIKASEGKLYNYPLTINFIGPASPDNHHLNQSGNEQFNNTQNQTL